MQGDLELIRQWIRGGNETKGLVIRIRVLSSIRGTTWASYCKCPIGRCTFKIRHILTPEQRSSLRFSRAQWLRAKNRSRHVSCPGSLFCAKLCESKCSLVHASDSEIIQSFRCWLAKNVYFV